VNKRRVIEFCRRLIESRLDVMWNCQSRVNAIDEERLEWMRRAGCDHIQYGIESGSPRLLAQLAKDITVEEIREACRATRAVGLTLSVYLISGVPGETEEDFRATRALIREIRPHDGLVAPLAVFPGTHLYQAMKTDGQIDDGYWIHERRDTRYMMEGPDARRSFLRLKRMCATAGRRARYTRADLERHKARLPDSFATWLASAEAYEAQGDVGSALSEYERTLELFPGNLWALARIGALLIGPGDPRGARLYIDRAIEAAPASPDLHRLAGMAPR